MPLGVSFYCFSQISFVVDSFNENNNYSFVEYCLYMTYFPKIIEGPIDRAESLIKQFNSAAKKKVDYENLYYGLLLLIYGLFKKVILADTFAKAVSVGYENINNLDSVNAFIVVLSFTLQIFLDFSGYTDMAIGISKMFNIDLVDNFDTPYAARSIGAFWKKWHISLTSFFTRYIYIPLGGNRNGQIKTFINILIVFILSGIWHGSTINYAIWGLINGIALIINKKFDKDNNSIFSWLLTFVFINLSWIVFRANTLNDALLIINKLFEFKSLNIMDEIRTCFDFSELDFVPERLEIFRMFKTSRLYVVIYLAIGFIVSIKDGSIKNKLLTENKSILFRLLIILIFAYCVMSFTSNNAFVYEGF